MASPSDRDLIVEIQEGRREALGALFDRHSAALYEFIYRITGDRDQSARLLIEVFSRVPSLVAGLSEHDLVRGWLYNLGREASLAFLRQKNWLDALPPSDEPSVSGLAGDIWHAARAMPAFHRAVLVVEELHGLSPTEKARALNVARTDLPRLLQDAHQSFNNQFDVQARQQGRPLSSQIDAERIWGMKRRIGTAGSLFGYLPAVVLPDSLASMARSQVLAGKPAEAIPPPQTEIRTHPQASHRPIETEIMPATPAAGPSLPGGCSLRVIVLALVIALVVMLLVLGLGFVLTRDTTAPTIARIEPADGATLPAGSQVVIKASYSDDRAVDVKSVRIVLDGIDETSQALISDSSLTYTSPGLDPGQHVVLVQLADTSGNKASRAWQFTLGSAEPTATPTVESAPPTSEALPTPIPPTITPEGPTPIPQPTPTLTPILPPVVTFTANETSVQAGTPVLLSWNVQNAQLVYLGSDKVDTSGTLLVTVNQTTDYHLIANNAGGTTDKTITINVLQLPDLTISDISLNANNQLQYTIKNTGTGDVTQQFLVELFEDNLALFSSYPIYSLPAGQGTTLFYPFAATVGTHTFTVRLNFTKVVQEANYNNNSLTVTIVGPTPTATSTATTTNTPVPTNTPTLTPTPTSTNTPTNTPTVTNTPIPQVTNVTISLTSSTPYTGTCPATFSFVAPITTNGPTNVTYQWETSGSGAPSATSGSLTFVTAGTQTAAFSSLSLSTTGNFSELIRVLTPNSMISGSVSFVNSCTP